MIRVFKDGVPRAAFHKANSGHLRESYYGNPKIKNTHLQAPRHSSLGGMCDSTQGTQWRTSTCSSHKGET